MPTASSKVASTDAGTGDLMQKTPTRASPLKVWIKASTRTGPATRLGEWPSVGELAARLGKGQQHIHDMLDDNRLKGIRTRVGWIVHPTRVPSGSPEKKVAYSKRRPSDAQRAGRFVPAQSLSPLHPSAQGERAGRCTSGKHGTSQKPFVP